ncbi:MAG: translation initiation factor IF-3 [bacterium]|nr:translation initiation factor IF-3 [bacterium]
MRIHRHRHRNRKPEIPEFKVNRQIKADEIRVIDNDKNMLGVMTVDQALALASEKGFDLIEVSPKANPPVCKLMEFGTFKYQKEKEAKKKRAASKAVETKGIRLSLKIGTNDFNVRLNQAKKFLEKGNKIRIEMILRGREKAYSDRAQEVFDRFIEAVSEDFEVKVETPLKRMHSKLHMIVARTK